MENLIENLNNKNPDVRASAAFALGQMRIQSEQEIPLLAQALGCPKCNIRSCSS